MLLLLLSSAAKSSPSFLQRTRGTGRYLVTTTTTTSGSSSSSISGFVWQQQQQQQQQQQPKRCCYRLCNTIIHPRMTTSSGILPRSISSGGGSSSSSHSSNVSSRNSTTSRRTFSSSSSSPSPNKKGKLLVLGGTGFLGSTVCERAVLEGYSVTSVTRNGGPSSSSSSSSSPSTNNNNIVYVQGDACDKQVLTDILNEGGYSGIIHCIGVLLDDSSGLGQYNRLFSGSGSVAGDGVTYDMLTRITAFNAIDAWLEVSSMKKEQQQSQQQQEEPIPFIFTSAAEVGWPHVPLGPFLERYVAPDFLKRYLMAKRTVEQRLLDMMDQQDNNSRNNNNNNNNHSNNNHTTKKNHHNQHIRPIIFRPSLIYTMDKPTKWVPAIPGWVGHKMGLPFVMDPPVNVRTVANAMVRSIGQSDIHGIVRYSQMLQLNQ